MHLIDPGSLAKRLIEMLPNIICILPVALYSKTTLSTMKFLFVFLWRHTCRYVSFNYQSSSLSVAYIRCQIDDTAVDIQSKDLRMAMITDAVSLQTQDVQPMVV